MEATECREKGQKGPEASGSLTGMPPTMGPNPPGPPGRLYGLKRYRESPAPEIQGSPLFLASQPGTQAADDTRHDSIEVLCPVLKALSIGHPQEVTDSGRREGTVGRLMMMRRSCR